MGGRGASFGGGENTGNGKKVEDNTPITLAGKNVAVTDKVVKTLGEENLNDAIAYINNAMKFLTGDDEYMELSIDGTASGLAYAHMIPSTGQMGLNVKLYTEDLSTLQKTYDADVKSGYHPKNTGMTDVFVHEMAHRLDRLIAEKQGWNSMASTKIVKAALDNVKKANKANGKSTNYYDIQLSLSGYGAEHYSSHTGDKYVETFAEAMADYNKNKGKANTLSKEIYKEMQKYL